LPITSAGLAGSSDIARIRSIKPEFWVSEQIAECSTNARLTFIGLSNFCDDHGVHPAKPKTLKAELYPMDDFSSADVAGWMAELTRVGLVAEFESEGEQFWHVTGLDKHQKIDRPSFKYPSPPPPNSPRARRDAFDEVSTNDPRAPSPGVEGSGVEGSGVESDSPKAHAARSSKTKPKTAMPLDFGISDRVRAWAAEKGYADLDAHFEAFVSKAKARGYTYADWDEGFMGAVRSDWAELRRPGAAGAHGATLDRDVRPAWLEGTGFADVFAAETAGCGPGNAHRFRDGRQAITA
jgi:hypothetical protein